MIENSVVKFVYSHIYDRILSELVGSFDDRQSNEIPAQIIELSKKWSRCESAIIKELNKFPPYKFKSEQIICYIVKNLPYTGISDPLTIRIKAGADLDLVITALIHELIHISIEPKEQELVSKVKREFPEATEFRTQLHVAVNYIEYEILKKMFDQATFDKIMRRELSLHGLKDSWKIVLPSKVKLSSIFPYLVAPEECKKPNKTDAKRR